uniref:Bacteriochlorophyll/chlorophyll synthetase n=1 Tax=uncultured crenarchaeote MCG TaxID=529375 RepID=B2YI68_9CREN|nr:bacteriochlorophyll/chlorophyll synthetase [uncultured crenarchaeote MCG]
MFSSLSGFARFISVERGFMLFMISVGASFLTAETAVWSSALFLGLIAFCIWSAADSINNVFDVELDVLSDPLRAEFTKRLGKVGLIIVFVFTGLSLALGAATMMPLVFLFVALGLVFGVLYSVPPFRLRKTRYKPVVNFTVGAVPVMIVAAYFGVSSFSVVSLVVLIGVTTAVNSLWEDLADYASDFASGARTVPVMFGFRVGLLFTVAMGYAMIPLMVLVGVFFELPLLYYVALSVLAVFISLRLIQKRQILLSAIEVDSKHLFGLGETLARDFVVIAIMFTLTLMLSSLLKIPNVLF